MSTDNSQVLMRVNERDRIAVSILASSWQCSQSEVVSNLINILASTDEDVAYARRKANDTEASQTPHASGAQ
jgi:hypothetical protein